MARPSTDALVAETLAPSVQTPAAFRTALADFLPLLSRVSQQAAALQGLAAVAELDEVDPMVGQKLHGFRQALGSIQAKHDRALDLLTAVQRAVVAYELEAAELDRVVNRPGDPPADAGNTDPEAAVNRGGG